ncbi:MAG: phosphoribosylformylglycinamidine cyclo-ligase [Aquificaceae bacterium]|nr:phosphoribosylformylglycinamidine cyclo-ligase [Aquificaceae bacterium]
MDEWTYEKAGVSIQRADAFVEYIKDRVRSLPGQVHLFGAFASGVELKSYKNPVLMLTADGVGTKLKIAQKVGVHHTVGIDLVAMNVNDLITTGAEPLGFLDYIATGRIDLEVLKRLMDGIVEGCRMAGVPLVGGETAEMPDFYPDGVYDLAGFCVGACEKESLITGRNIKPGDVILGLPSSGFHSNGYSLIRKVLEARGISYEDYAHEFKKPVWEVLLEPTRIYTEEVKLLKASGVEIKGMAHITGGGVPGNLIRILPEGCRAVVDSSLLPNNPTFTWIADLGKVRKEEMFKPFNWGFGFMLVLEEGWVSRTLSVLEDAFVCGKVESGERDVVIL